MTHKRRKLIYFLVAFLFMLILCVIGWLAYVLFSMQNQGPNHPQTAQLPLSKKTLQTPSPVNEVVITLPADEQPTGGNEPNTTQELLLPITAARIPAVCEGYGPQIRARPAYVNPITQSSVLTPTRATVTLFIPDKQDDR